MRLIYDVLAERGELTEVQLAKELNLSSLDTVDVADRMAALGHITCKLVYRDRTITRHYNIPDEARLAYALEHA